MKLKDGHYIDEFQNEVWVQDGKYHRVGGPAYIGTDGYMAWCQNGKYHIIDGPARIWPDGSKEYWLNGKYYPQIQNEVQWKMEVQKWKRQQKED